MTRAWLIFQREFKAYFSSPIFYVIVSVFLIVTGITFALYMRGFMEYCGRYVQNGIQGMEDPKAVTPNINSMLFEGVFGNMALMLILLAPFMTMRAFAEEKRAGTAEILFTYPFRDWEIVLAKFAACGTVLSIMLSMTLMIPVMLHPFGHFSWPVLLLGYFALLLTGLSYVAVGLFFSSLTENQIVAAALSMASFLAIGTIRYFQGVVGQSLGDLLAYVSIIPHQDNLLRGVMDTRDLAYFAAFVFIGLFMTLRSLEIRRLRA